MDTDGQVEPLGWSLGAGVPGLVSIVVPVYNQEWCLTDTLVSVAAQSYRPLECIIVDDGSTDRTPEIIKDFAERHRSDFAIKAIRKENGGVQRARNRGIEESCGEFIQVLDGDDMLSPNKISSQVSFLNSEEGARSDVVYGDSTWLIDDGVKTTPGDTVGLGREEDFLVSLLNHNTFNTPFAYLCRRSAVERVGRWDPSLRINEDVDYWSRMACLGLRFTYLPVNTGLYRRHNKPRMSEQHVRIRAEDTLRIYKSIYRMLEENKQFTPQRRRALAQAFYSVSCWASLVDKALWREGLQLALALDKNVMPTKYLSRCLQRVMGIWASERLKTRWRKIKGGSYSRPSLAKQS